MGPHWSDTEYETRRHVGLYLMIGLATALAFGYFLVEPEVAAGWIWPWPVLVLLVVLMMLLTPVLCSRYYEISRPVRASILLALAVKFVLLLLLVIALALPLVRLDLDTLGDRFMTLANDSIADMTDRLEFLNNATAMILGIVTGALLALLKVLSILLAAALVPALAVAAFRWLQQGVDLLVERQLLPKRGRE